MNGNRPQLDDDTAKAWWWLGMACLLGGLAFVVYATATDTPMQWGSAGVLWGYAVVFIAMPAMYPWLSTIWWALRDGLHSLGTSLGTAGARLVDAARRRTGRRVTRRMLAAVQRRLPKVKMDPEVYRAGRAMFGPDVTAASLLAHVRDYPAIAPPWLDQLRDELTALAQRVEDGALRVDGRTATDAAYWYAGAANLLVAARAVLVELEGVASDPGKAVRLSAFDYTVSDAGDLVPRSRRALARDRQERQREAIRKAMAHMERIYAQVRQQFVDMGRQFMIIGQQVAHDLRALATVPTRPGIPDTIMGMPVEVSPFLDPDAVVVGEVPALDSLALSRLRVSGGASYVDILPGLERFQAAMRDASDANAARDRMVYELAAGHGDVLLLSVRERFASRIWDGTKTVEVRRVRPRADTRVVVIYEPESRAITGLARVSKLLAEDNGTGPTVAPVVEWHHGLEEAELDAYLSGAEQAHGIVLADVWHLAEPLPLTTLDPAITRGPQGFRYLTADQRDALTITLRTARDTAGVDA